MRAAGAARACEAGALVVSLLLWGVARAQSAGEWRSSEQLWRSTCAYCHNDHIAAELRGTSLTAPALVSTARNGLKSMPAFLPSQVSDAELTALADWLSRQKRPPAEEADRGDRTSRHGSRDRGR